MEEIIKDIALDINRHNGKTYYVGGYVRDKLLNIENKDIDIEVHGITEDVLLDILKNKGTVLSYGSSFAVYSLKGLNVDIALPRKERKSGEKHTDFIIETDPFIGEENAARRRDFTINSIMMNVLTKEIIDPFNGLNDLEKGIIRHIDENSFVEDPLRVFRACQFASRFNFKIDEKTIELCKTIDVSSLSKERVEEETKKALVKGNRPSVYFDCLRKMNRLDEFYPEIKKLIGLKQDPTFHPEGDVYNHTMKALDAAVKYRNKVSDPYKFMLFVLCHDLGKIITTELIDGRYHAYGHETKGIPVIRQFLNNFTSNKDVIHYVTNMARLHMKPNLLALGRSAVKKTNRMFYDAKDPVDLIYFALCDKEEKENDERKSFLFDRLSIFNRMMEEPYVTGKDLINAGLKPDESFKTVLDYALKLRLSGIKKDSALKQCLSFYKSVK